MTDWWYCKDCESYFTFHSIMDEALWSMARNNCKRCHSDNIIPKELPDDGYSYNIWETCMTCGEMRLVCSGTGSCRKCDGD